MPVWRLSDAAGGYVRWADGGKTITWALGPTFHRLPLADAPSTFAAGAERQSRRAKEAARRRSGKKDEQEERRSQVDRSRLEAEFRSRSPCRAPAPQGSFVLRGARVVTMKGERECSTTPTSSSPATGSRPSGPLGQVAVPAGAREFDAQARRSIPGLIDTHAHLHYSGFEIVPGDQVGVPREPRLRRDHGLRPVGALARRLRPGRAWSRRGCMTRAARLLLGRRAVRRPAGGRSSPRSTAWTTRAGRCGA